MSYASTIKDLQAALARITKAKEEVDKKYQVLNIVLKYFKDLDEGEEEI